MLHKAPRARKQIVPSAARSGGFFAEALEAVLFQEAIRLIERTDA
jgi:hypothetical protein